MNELLITKHTNAWNWHLIAIMFLNTAIIMMAIGRPLWALSSIGVLLFTEFMAYRRKAQMERMEVELNKSGGENAKED